jgi:glycosyltransferase involved in cell wall biosynthesis
MFSGYGARVTRELMERIEPDVVFSHGFYGFGRNMPRTLTGLGIPWVHYVHSYGLICKRQTAVDNHGHACKRQCADCAVVCRFKHGKAPLRKAIAVYNSAHMREVFERAGIVSRETHVIDPVFGYNAPEVSGTYAPGRPIRLVYVGRLSRVNGVRLLCEAVAGRGEDYRLEVIGGGPMLAELEGRYGDGAIVFHGQVEPERRDALLREGHALVVPSLWNEPFGRVVQEGFLAGIPVIAADVGGMAGLVRDGVDGMVFKWREGAELQALKGALEEAGRRLPELRTGALETRGRLMGQDNFGLIEELLLRAVGETVTVAGGGLL